MNRSLMIVIGALALGAVVLAGSYYVGQRAGFAYAANPADDLSWLRMEYHLSADQMARVRRLHEGYKPECVKMCALIAGKKAELQATLANGTNVTVEAEKELTELGELRAQCQAQMLRHFIAVSQAMPPAEGRRYLAEMEKITLGSHEEIEQSMSEHAGHEHGTQ
ncbi:MAG TPA: periplasmic heavy metal sensor [Verrucomicrobiae bacterium]|nr:periplasmic heavy metal sensor [Verrucomicrobiae bacterium]